MATTLASVRSSEPRRPILRGDNFEFLNLKAEAVEALAGMVDGVDGGDDNETRWTISEGGEA